MSPGCPTRAELDSFQAGDLEETALAAVSSHVEGCPNCQRSLETIIGDSADTVLHALLEEPEPSPFASEAACRMAIERVAAIAGGATPDAEKLIPTVALKLAPNSGDDALPLETIREYKLLAKLGEGGMGAVYKALHTRLDKVVALKVLPQGRMRDGGSVARFQREMKAVGRLDHPNIVRAMDAGEEDGTHFLVMEYVEGTDLSLLTKNVGPLPVADACELVRQAALGLQEAHEHGMVHRDIKPSNLILARSPRKKSPPTLKILDLGLALLAEALSPDQGLTSTGQMMGTIDYMAPEQGSDTHRVDIRADIYSLGATLYRLLTGTAPFAGEKFDTPVKKILALATKEPAAVQTLRTDVPPGLAAVIHKLLAKDPTERYATPEELAEALTPFCQGANLAALLERGTQPAQPNTSEAPTHPQLSSGSVDTAPTIDRSIKLATKSKPPSRTGLVGLGRRIPRHIAITAACGGAALVILLGVVFYLETLKGTIRIEINDDKIKVALDEKGATFEGAHKTHSIRVQPGPHGLRITCGDLAFTTDKFELTKGETVRLSVTYLEGKVDVVDTRSKKSLGHGIVPQLAGSGWHGWPKNAPRPAIAPFNAKEARKHQEEWADYLGVPVEYENSIGMKFVLIPPGEFMMGNTPAEIGEALKFTNDDKHWEECVKSESPKHKVILTQSIYLGVHEVTERDYAAVMGKNPSHFSPMGAGKDLVAGLDTNSHPVETVSWNDAAEFCAKLSENEKLKPFYFRAGETVTPLGGTGYRLPSEAEWEYSCRAGTTTKYWIGDKDEDLTQAGWCNPNSGSRTHAVGELKGNPFGLYDVHGNVWEWVQDWWEPTYYAQFQKKPALDPSGPSSAGLQRAIRGGIWSGHASRCRASYRYALDPTVRRDFIGFRASLPVDAVKVAIAERKTKQTIASAGWHGWPKDAPKPAIAPFTAEQARKHQREWADYLGVPVEYENSIGMKFVLIPPGEFLMGSPAKEVDELLKAWDVNDTRGPLCIKSATPQHRVILTRAAYASVQEVRQRDYQSVMGANPSVFAKTGENKELAEKVADLDTADFPVDSVSWLDATDFCSALSRREKLKSCYSRVENKVTLREATGYRLPSEAEWEFTCRAGSTTPYWVGDGNEDLYKAGWFGGNSGGRRHAVGELQANPFGLYDLHGNAWEWVQDWWEPSYQEPTNRQPTVNPQNESLTGKSERALRGGNWRGIASLCRSSFRDARDYWHRHQDYGFRVWLSTDAVKAAIAEREAKPDQVVDLLQLVDVEHDSVKGKWTRTADGLASDAGIPYCRLKLPYAPPPEYDFRVEFTAQGGNDILQLFTAGGRSCTWLMGAWGGRHDGFDTVKDHPLTREGTNIIGGPTSIRRGQRHTSIVQVRRDSIAATIDGKLVVRHATDGSDLGIPGDWSIGEGAIGLGTTFDAVVFHKVELVVPAAPDKSSGWHGWPKDAPKAAIAPFSAQEARKHQEEWAEYLGVPVEYENSLRMKFVLIPPGEFLMGSTPAEIEEALKFVDAREEVLKFTNGKYELWRENIKSGAPQHKVILTQPMYLGVHEVTQAEYEKVMGKNPSYFAKTGPEKQWAEKVAGIDTSGHPVEGVSWNDAAEFCAKLSKNEKHKAFYFRSGETVAMLEGTGYRLPTEAQWEFACRAGTPTKYWIGDKDEDLVQAAWFGTNSASQTHRVGELKANPLGLYDIHGNVREWVQDGREPKYFEQFQDKPALNPIGPQSARFERVFRGGPWAGPAIDCRASHRNANGPTYSDTGIGFRVSLPVDAVKQDLKDRATIPTATRDFALRFTDAGERLEIPDLKFLKGGPWTVEGWVTPRDPLPKDWAASSLVFRVSEAALVVKHTGPGGVKWSAGGPSTKAPPSINSDKVVELNKPVHVALMRGPEGVSFYLNGVLQGEPLQILVSGHDATLDFCLADPKWHKIPFHGDLDEFRVSSVARYHETFTPKPRFEPDADTLALYHFDEGEGDVLKDSSGKDHHAKITAAKWVKGGTGK